MAATILFRGSDIFNETSAAGFRLTVGPIQQESQQFRLFGIDGAFLVDNGLQGRLIVAEGFLVEASIALMNSRETTINNEIKTRTAGTLEDRWGRTFTNCVIDRYELLGPRLGPDGNSQYIQPCRVIFFQMTPP